MAPPLATPEMAVPCQYCSVVSRANGEDPIGTAIAADRWLMIEVPRPWAKDPWQGESAPLLAVFQALGKQPRRWLQTRILAIAPDRHYSRPGHRHVLSYQRPGPIFTQYSADHYCVPLDQLPQLVEALLLNPSGLTAFEQDRQPPLRSLFVCTHTHYDVACGRFGTPLFNTLRRDYARDGQIQVWQTGHFGGHNFAPTLIDFPQGQFWGHVEPEILDGIVHRRGDVAALRQYYRGWGGLSRWGQVAERELWMTRGWSWLDVPKGERRVRQDPGQLLHRILQGAVRRWPGLWAQGLWQKLEQKRTWAEVEIQTPAESSSGPHLYTARVEVSHRVMTQLRSGETADLYPAKQYQVRFTAPPPSPLAPSMPPGSEVVVSAQRDGIAPQYPIAADRQEYPQTPP